MPRFFIDEPNGPNAVITGQDAVHIGKSLRMKTGDELILCSNGTEGVRQPRTFFTFIIAQTAFFERGGAPGLKIFRLCGNRAYSFICFRLCLNQTKWIL